jgi:hypothetical protein
MVQTPNADLYRWDKDDDMATSLEGMGVNSEKLDSLLSESNFYDEITYAKYRDVISSTDYFITYVPKYDKNGKLIKLKHGYQNDLMNSGNGETARNFAARKTASLVVNASRWDLGGSGLIRGIQIQDGVINQQHDGLNAYTLGINADNQLKAFPNTVTAQQILDQGYVDAVTAFFPMIENGVAVDSNIYLNSVTKEPRQAIAQLANGDILFLTCHGRNSNNTGMSYADMIRILLARGATFAYNLDGGGSTQTNVRGVTVNDATDDAGKTERPVTDFLYIDSPATFKQKFSSIPVDMGHMGKRINDIAADVVANKDANAATKLIADSLNGRFPEIQGRVTDYATINKTGFYWSLGAAVGTPNDTSSWFLLHIQASDVDALQVAFPFSHTLNSIMLRRTNTGGGSYGAWRAM